MTWRAVLGVLAMALLAAPPATAWQQSEPDMHFRAPFPVLERAETAVGPGGSPFCEGDGVSGPRIQAVYAYLQGQTNNLEQNRATIRTMASGIDQAFDVSAGRNGGSAHPRWAFDEGTCNLSIIPVEVPVTAPDNFDHTLQALRGLGLLSRLDRKYLVWLDAEGNDNLIATLRFDDTPDPATNENNGNPAPGNEASVAQLARNGGWDTDGYGGSYVAWGPQHELAHMLGAVQDSAPHGDGFSHCTEEFDAMCFGGSNNPTCGKANDQESFLATKPLLDCNHDDYFAISPAAGSYLATHWNIYNSSFLHRSDTPSQGGGGGDGDSTPPVPTIDAPAKTKLKGKVPVAVSADEASTLAVAAKLRFEEGGKANRGRNGVKLPEQLVPLVAGETTQLKIRIPGNARDRAADVLGEDGTVTLIVRATATDVAGNSGKAKAKIRLR